MELNISKKPLIKSITQMLTEVKLFTEVTGQKPHRIACSQSQFDYYADQLSKMAESLELTMKAQRLLEPSLDGIPMYVRNDQSIPVSA